MDQTLTQLDVQDSRIAGIEVKVRAQVIMGDKNLQLGSVHGGILNLIGSGERLRMRPKAVPVFVLPQPLTGLLDRTGTVELAMSALMASQPVEFYGPGGVGKTSLMRFLAHHTMTQNFPDGVVYLYAGNTSPGDLLQSIFEAFYEFDVPYKPSQSEIRQSLHSIRALILLDDFHLEHQYVESLLESAPESSFVLASEERHLWGKSPALPLQGLPEKQALDLLVRELGRPLQASERETAKKMCHRLGGYPLYLIQAVTLVRQQKRTLIELASLIDARSLDTGLAEAFLETTSPSERRVLTAIGTLGGAALHKRHLPQLSQIPNVEPVIQRLLRQGLILPQDQGYILTAGLQSLFELRGVLERWRVWALDYFRSWAKENQDQTHEIVLQAEGLIFLVEWALDAGEPRRALRLSRAMEGALAAGCRWDAWNQVLYNALQAAQTLQDLPAKAWALHQIGTRALCLGEQAVARRQLIRAFLLRQSLGDWAGSAITRHNLELLAPSDSSSEIPAAVSIAEKKPSASGSLKSILLMALLVILGALGLIAAVLNPSAWIGISNFLMVTKVP